MHKDGQRELKYTRLNGLSVNPIMLEIDADDRTNTVCAICNKDYISRKSYRAHMNTAHKDGKREPANVREKIDPNVVPIWVDQNNYCRSCGISYSSNCTYQEHIRRIHRDVLKKSKQLPSSSPTS